MIVWVGVEGKGLAVGVVKEGGSVSVLCVCLYEVVVVGVGVVVWRGWSRGIFRFTFSYLIQLMVFSKYF